MLLPTAPATITTAEKATKCHIVLYPAVYRVVLEEHSDYICRYFKYAWCNSCHVCCSLRTLDMSETSKPSIRSRGRFLSVGRQETQLFDKQVQDVQKQQR